MVVVSVAQHHVFNPIDLQTIHVVDQRDPILTCVEEDNFAAVPDQCSEPVLTEYPLAAGETVLSQSIVISNLSIAFKLKVSIGSLKITPQSYSKRWCIS